MGIGGLDNYLYKTITGIDKNLVSSTRLSTNTNTTNTNIHIHINSPEYHGIRRVHLSEYRGKTIAIDFSWILTKFCLRRKKDFHENSYLHELENFINIWCNINGCILVFVFDGKPHKLKKKTLDKRRTIKQNLLSKIDDLIINTDIGNETKTKTKIDKIEDLQRKSVSITQTQIDNCKAYMKMLGIEFIHINDIEGMEAETIFPYLFKTKRIDACFTADTDSHAYGCKIILKDFDYINHTVQEDNHEVILNYLQLTRDEFVNVCVLSKNDYTKGLIYCKIDAVFDLVRKFGNIPSIIKHIQTTYPNTQLDTQLDTQPIKTIQIPHDFEYDKIKTIFTSELPETARLQIDNSHRDFLLTKISI